MLSCNSISVGSNCLPRQICATIFLLISSTMKSSYNYTGTELNVQRDTSINCNKHFILYLISMWRNIYTAINLYICITEVSKKFLITSKEDSSLVIKVEKPLWPVISQVSKPISYILKILSGLNSAVQLKIVSSTKEYFDILHIEKPVEWLLN